ncbi:polyprenyl synthetase family protein [Anaeromyxobacter sp. Fw109-5]|uniref:polyprenyl synthetase family protein n=1 Tax=Anaeromyxobacter sp. (strain Fw109-5) TaxID=404589 RepID=UPI00059DFDF3|nr:polyprenyl synthetase family protein [Anaeromyxobacter sp. Fw109-5]
MPPDVDIQSYLRSVTERLEPRLAALADERRGQGPERLVEAIRYALLGGGKRLRPALVLAACEAHGGDASDGSLAMRFAVALEAVHTYSLVHDDLPAMDDDDLRRGRPTVHKAYDEATAVLVGDALQSLAFRHLLAAPQPTAAALARLLAENAYLMVEGQARDIQGEHARLAEAEVLELMRTKTGALLASAVAGGAACAGAAVEAVYPIGLKLGLAFQIADDLLDLTADTQTLGKRAGKDADAGKSTLPALVGIEEARRRAAALLDEALAALAPLGARAEPLRAVARYVVARKK